MNHATRFALPVRTVATLALVAAFSAPGFAQQQDSIPWRTDFEAARSEARTSGKLLVIVVHQEGEPGNDGMARDVYAHPRFKKALAGTVPVFVGCCQKGAELLVAGRIGLSVDAVKAVRSKAWTFLFGGYETAPTPQFLCLHPDGSVLFHHVRTTSRQQLEKGLRRAKVLMKSAGTRQKEVLRRVRDLQRAARSDEDAWCQLCVLLRHCPVETFAKAMSVLRKEKELVRRILVHLAKHESATMVEQRLEVLHRGHRDLIAGIRKKLAEKKAAQPAPPAR